MEVYGAEFAYVSVLEALAKLRNMPLDPNSSPHPILFEEKEELKKEILSNLPEVPDWLRENNKQVIGIGRNCLYSIASILLGKETFSKEDVEALIDQSYDKIDEDFKEIPYPKQGMPALIFLHTVMEHCGIDQVTFCKTNGSAEGVLITPYLWEQQF